MPYAALSSAPSPVSLDDCRFLLISETAQDSCRPLHIPLRVCRNASSSRAATTTAAAATTSDKRSDAKLVLGKCRTELYWALERVPNAHCAWKHVVIWVERLDEAMGHSAATATTAVQHESLPRLAGNTNCAAHPALPSCVVRILCVGQQAINIIRFSDHSIVTVAPGQPQILKAYDCIVLGDMHAVGQNATLRFCPVLKVARGLADTESNSRQERENASSMSSSTSLVSLDAKRSLFTIPDESRNESGDAAMLTCTHVTALIIADVVANLQVLGMAVPIAPPRSTIVPRPSVPSHPVMLVDDESPPHHASHVSESDNESSHILSAALCAPIEATPPPPGTAAVVKKVSSIVPRHDVVELDPNVTVPHARHAGGGRGEAECETTLGGRKRRARSDSTNCTFSQQIIPPPPQNPPSKCVDGCGGSLEDTSDQDVLMVPGSSSAGCRSKSPLHRHVVTSAGSSAASSALPPAAGASLQESFDERWDEQLLALEAQSAAARGADIGSPPRLLHPLGCGTRMGGVAGSSEVVLRRQVVARGDSSPGGTVGMHYPQPESQMVYFGHSQE